MFILDLVCRRLSGKERGWVSLGLGHPQKRPFAGEPESCDGRLFEVEDSMSQAMSFEGKLWIMG